MIIPKVNPVIALKCLWLWVSRTGPRSTSSVNIYPASQGMAGGCGRSSCQDVIQSPNISDQVYLWPNSASFCEDRKSLPSTFSIYEGDSISNEACIFMYIHMYLYARFQGWKGGTMRSDPAEPRADVAPHLTRAGEGPPVQEHSDGGCARAGGPWPFQALPAALRCRGAPVACSPSRAHGIASIYSSQASRHRNVGSAQTGWSTC